MAARFYPQERSRTCAVASLRSVLASQFGVHVREDVLRFAGDVATDPILMSGTDTAGLRRILRVANQAANTGPLWRLRVKAHGTIADLAKEIRRGRFPIASVVRGAALHAIVVCGYKPGKVRYFDPATGRTCWCGAGAFRAQWRDEGYTWFGVVTGGLPKDDQ